MSENGEIYTAGKNFTLPPALTTWTNFTSDAWNPATRTLNIGHKTVLLNKIELFDKCNDDEGHCTLEPLPLTVETCG